MVDDSTTSQNFVQQQMLNAYIQITLVLKLCEMEHVSWGGKYLSFGCKWWSDSLLFTHRMAFRKVRPKENDIVGDYNNDDFLQKFVPSRCGFKTGFKPP